jgi:tripartite-type tricarboxylate transporter receptor subunit TctC
MAVNRRQTVLHLAAAAAASGLALPRAFAQAPAWPAAKPIRLIVNFPAGGSPDAVARAVSTPLATALGQQIVIDNRGGAGGMIGNDLLAKAAPDGYTIGLSSGSAQAILPLLNNKMLYDAAKDLQPVAAGARLELFLVCRADAPYKNFKEFLEHMRRNPGRLSYGSPGNGTSPHIAGEMLKSQTNTFSVHIPYRGSAAVLTDLLAGNLDYTFDPGIAFQHVRSGRLRLLGVGSTKRLSMFPDAATLIELGLPGFDVGTTHGFWAPSGVPALIVERLNREINRTLGLPEVVTAIRALGAEPQPLTPAQFGALIKADMERFGKVIRERKITADS